MDGPPREAMPKETEKIQRKLTSLWQRLVQYPNLLILVACLLLTWQAFHALSLRQQRGARLARQRVLAEQGVDTLVVYVFAPTDKEYYNNLLYFAKHAIKADDPCHYWIILQQANSEQAEPELYPLPPNAKYVSHVNECMDLGTVGWLLFQIPDLSVYKYFMWVNSSVRGPIMPAYWPPDKHWTRAWIDRLSDTVRLVGPTVNCGGVDHPDFPFIVHPHLQSYAIATDYLGLKLLIDSKHVFKCHKNYRDTVKFGEMGQSKVMLDAGYNIDCFMLRYQGVDWRNKEFWECNNVFDPLWQQSNDGVSLEPTEVLFIKMKNWMVAAQWEPVQVVKTHSALLEMEANSPDHIAMVQENKYHHIVEQRIKEAKKHGQRCFDYNFFPVANPELQNATKTVMWDFYIKHGALQGRGSRFRC